MLKGGDNYSDWTKNYKGIWVISDTINIIGVNNSLENFSSHRGLFEIRMPDTIIEIGDSAFSWCNKIKSIKLSSNITKIGPSAFHCCYDLVNISLPESLEIIEHGAFYYCTSLESITIPKNVETIENNAFSTCSNVMSIEFLSEENLVLGDYAFCSLENVKSLTITSNIKEIGQSCFTGMSDLESLEIEDGVQIIGEGAFAGCAKLTEVVFPKTVHTISMHTDDPNAIGACGIFENCTNLESVDLSKTTIEDLINDCFMNCTNLKTVLLPTTLKKLGLTTFSCCYSLENLELPETIEKMDRLVFGSTIPNVPIPNLTINYNGTKSQWDSIEKAERLETDLTNGMVDLGSSGWNENINITVKTADDEIITYEPR